MSGRKRALLRMNERDRQKLKNIESRLGQVDQDFSSLAQKIEMIKIQVYDRTDEIHNEREIAIDNSISQLDWRIREIEEATQIAIERYSEEVYSVNNRACGIKDDIEDRIVDHSNLVLNLLGQYMEDLNAETSSLINFSENFEIQNRNLQECSWQTLMYAQELITSLTNQYSLKDGWKTSLDRIFNLVSTGWTDYQLGAYQAGLVCAQQSVLDLVEFRYNLQKIEQSTQLLRIKTLEKTIQILDLAKNCQNLPAIDLDGNILSVSVDVDYWTGGLLKNAIQILNSLHNELMNPETKFDLLTLEELIKQTLPDWEKALHDYVSMARIEIIAAQTRYEVARTVVDALGEQGFELNIGAYETDDMRSPYHLLLENLEGNKVHVSVIHTDENPLNYLLEIDSYDSEIRTESELRQRTKELLGSVENSGIRVDQVYRSDPNHSKAVKETSSHSYKMTPNSNKQFLK